ncbi:prepilin peptidase [Geomicrobium sp. JCM 19038]|uniref:A24 family peptidase n=1 Tax=Geomicrobium sp. JCM 19038 TaxID=1460635 RepID=UPI00045F1030|nr:A24 family peptidase [Geomicrobium sp. JCM 19038]GAK07805.1 type IV prepilin peptidase TadV/CpaA [Geomicrobium sp. JCM 19038]
MVSISILATTLLIATIIDLRTWKIPNWLTLSAAIIGITHNGMMYGFDGLFTSLLGMVIGFAIFFCFYLMKAYGAGDVKLMAAIGAIMGVPFILYSSIMIVLIGGLVSIVVLIVRHRQHRRSGTEKKEVNTAFPFSLWITVGSVLTVWQMYP